MQAVQYIVVRLLLVFKNVDILTDRVMFILLGKKVVFYVEVTDIEFNYINIQCHLQGLY